MYSHIRRFRLPLPPRRRSRPCQMTTELPAIESAVAAHYARALAAYGATYRGVDWSSRESQELRFATLLDGVDWGARPTMLDYGCGWGAMADHLDRLGIECQYVGYDIAPQMIAAARLIHSGRQDRRFTADVAELRRVDHVIASGVFNLRLHTPGAMWTRHVKETIARFATLTRRRLAFNMLSRASAPALERADLYYADPHTVARYSEAVVGGPVSVREDYGLREFTVIVSPGDA